MISIKTTLNDKDVVGLHVKLKNGVKVTVFGPSSKGDGTITVLRHKDRNHKRACLSLPGETECWAQIPSRIRCRICDVLVDRDVVQNAPILGDYCPSCWDDLTFSAAVGIAEANTENDA